MTSPRTLYIRSTHGSSFSFIPFVCRNREVFVRTGVGEVENGPEELKQSRERAEKRFLVGLPTKGSGLRLVSETDEVWEGTKG